ncbi:hypothetical protein [Peribacillus sp. Bi96]|uniref:hypothetical protein n=1 Tax=Peribacillus sp. Bi96 TaxID=2884273 RepID=UPI001E30AB58|nr:hypothetical protein [Peribacillus sp. Bi96]
MKLPFAILGLSFIPQRWTNAITKKDRPFFIEQVLRLLLSAIVLFLVIDIMLVDFTVPAFFSSFAFILGLILIIDSRMYVYSIRESSTSRRNRKKNEGTNQLNTPWNVHFNSLLGGVLIAAWVVMLFYHITFAGDLHGLAKVDKKNELEEVQDIKTMPLVTVKMADAKGDAAINKIQNASYFTEGEYRLTNINSELAYTSPIEMDGFFKAGRAEYTPGYNLISAVSTDKGASTVQGKMLYAPSQYLDHDLERTIRKAYPKKIIHDSYLEPNEDGKPYFVASVGHYLKYRSGSVVDGVVLVNPENGDTKYYPLGKEPKWVDRTFTLETALEYWTYWGKYVHGWKNQSLIGAKKDVLIPNEDNMQVTFNEKGELIYVVDFTRAKSKGNSKTLVGYGVFNAKTGEMTYYKGVTSVLTGKEAKSNANASEFLSKYPGWKATNGIFYTIYGAPTYVIPVTKGSKFQGVAIVYANSDNPQVVFGKTKDEAFRNYKKLIASLGKVSGVTPQKGFEMKEIKGKVTRINDANLPNGYVFYLIVEGNGKRFTVDPGVNALSDIVLTKEGDRVVLKVMDMDEDVVPVDQFNNLDLPKQ